MGRLLEASFDAAEDQKVKDSEDDDRRPKSDEQPLLLREPTPALDEILKVVHFLPRFLPLRSISAGFQPATRANKLKLWTGI